MDRSTNMHLKKRLIIEISLGILLNFMVSLIAFPEEKYSIEGYLFMMFMFIFVAEPIFIFHNLLERRWPWNNYSKRRIVALLLIAVIWFVITKDLGLRIAFVVIPDANTIEPHSFNASLWV